MGRKKQAKLELTAKDWQRFCNAPASLGTLLEQKRGPDVARELAEGLAPGGALNTAPCTQRLQVLALLEAHAADFCGDAPQDVVRHLFEMVRDRAAAPGDAPEAAARLQLAALHALTTLMIKLEMPQRDARLVKVHIEALFRIMERSGPYAEAPAELCHAAATCLRRMEEAAPTLLLVGSKQLLELARHETSAAAESYAMLAARVISHAAARCLDQKAAQASEEGSGHGDTQEAGAAQQGEQQREGDDVASQTGLSLLSSIDVRALSLGAGAGCSQLGPAARAISPVGTLDAAALPAGMTFGSGRTGASSDDFSSPKEVPGSPRGVGSIVGTVSTVDSSGSRALAAAAAQQGAAAANALAAHMARGLSISSSEISGSVQLDSTAPQMLLAPDGPGLKHFRVPQHIHWPDALGHAAVCVYITPDALQDLQRACLEFLAAMPRLSVEGVACLTAVLPPIMRLAELPPEQLQAALDALLHSGRTLMLQAVLKLYPEVPADGSYADWQRRLVDSVLLMVNGPHPAEHRVIAITWALVQHHAQMHGRRPSLFAGTWRQLMPRSDDPPQLLSLKVKALSACLAVGIGHAEEVVPMVFAWDGFWQAAPSDQQLRLATYALRMLGSAAMSYAAASPAVVESARRRDAPSAAALAPALASKPASPHYVRACLVSACLQLLATRPQYLPAVEAFLAHCSASCPELQLTLLNAIDALFSAAATCTFKSLEPPCRPGVPVRKQRSRLYSAAGSAAGAASPPAAGSPGSDNDGSPGKQRSLTSVLARMRRTVTKRMGSASASPKLSPEAAAGSLQAAAELGAGGGGGGSALPPIAEVALSMAAPQPPPGLASLEEAEAWLWDSRTWGTLSGNMAAHDPIAYRPLLLRLAQSGTGVLPMGALRLLAAYASQYQGELPSHELPAKEAGSAVLAICQAAAMTHLLIGPAGRGRGRGAAGDDGGAGAHHQADGGATPQWTLQQEEVAAGMQAVLSALTSHFPSDNVRRRAQSFLDLLANPSAWDLRVRMGTMAKMLGGYFSDAVSAANYL
ncbi:hypothetical protein ABPG77_001660 [Micractinium sp. CCAP 211/92]